MSEKLHTQSTSLDLEKEIKDLELDDIVQVQDSFYYDTDIESPGAFYTFEEIKISRQALAILLPEIKFNSDQQLYEDMKNEAAIFEERDEYFDQTDNLIQRKIIFPEKNAELEGELEKGFLYDVIMYEIARASAEENIYDTFMNAKDLKILFPEKFKQLDLLRLFRSNSWQERIKYNMEYMRNIEQSENYCDFATDLAFSINIVNYPDKIAFDSLEWLEYKEFAKTYMQEMNYTNFLEYMMKLKIIAAKDVCITKDSFHLIS